MTASVKSRLCHSNSFDGKPQVTARRKGLPLNEADACGLPLNDAVACGCR